MVNPGICMTQKVFKKREYEKHILRKIPGGAWTVAHRELENQNYDILEFTTELQTYTISMADAIKHGRPEILDKEWKLVIPLWVWNKSLGIMPKVNHLPLKEYLQKKFEKLTDNKKYNTKQLDFGF